MDAYARLDFFPYEVHAMQKAYSALCSFLRGTFCLACKMTLRELEHRVGEINKDKELLMIFITKDDVFLIPFDNLNIQKETTFIISVMK